MIKALFIFTVIGVSFGSGYLLSQKLFQAKLDAQLVIAQKQALKTFKIIAAAEQARRAAEQNLEDLANAQPETAPACLPRERVRRLNLR